MAVSFTLISGGSTDVDGTSFALSPASVPADTLLLAAVQVTGTNVIVPDVTGFGLSWTLVAQQPWDVVATPTRKLLLYRAAGTPTPGPDTLLVSHNSQVYTGFDVILFSAPGAAYSNNGADGIRNFGGAANDTATTSVSVTLPAFASATNGTLGLIGRNGTVDPTPGSGFTKMVGTSGTTPSRNLMVEYKATSDTTVDATMTSIKNGAMGVEIVEAGGAATRNHTTDAVLAAPPSGVKTKTHLADATITSIAVRSLLSYGSSSNLASYVTGTVTPTSDGTMWMVAVHANVEAQSLTGMGLTWTKVGTTCPYATSTSPTKVITLFWATGTPSAGALTAGFSTTADHCLVQVVETSGASTTDPFVQVDAFQNDTSIANMTGTLNPFASSDNVPVAFVGRLSTTGAQQGTSMNQIGAGVATSSNPTASMTVLTAPFPDNTIESSFSASYAGMLAVELRRSGLVAAPEAGWQPTAFEGGGFQNCISLNPFNPSRLVIGSDVAGTHRSLDGGASWETTLTGIEATQQTRNASIAHSQVTPGRVFMAAGAEGGGGGFFVSDDDGFSWSRLSSVPQFSGSNNSSPLPTTHPRSTGNLIALDEGNGYIYVGTYNGGVMRSDDGGANWTVIWGSGSYIRSLVIDPANAQALVVGVYNAGGFSKAYRLTSIRGTASASQLTALPTSVEELSFGPSGALYAACGTSGIYKSTTSPYTSWSAINSGGDGIETTGPSWQTVHAYNQGSGADRVWAGCSNPVDVGGSQYASVKFSADGGTTWQTRSVPGTNGVTIDQTIYGEAIPWWMFETGANKSGSALMLNKSAMVASQIIVDDAASTPKVFVAGRSGAWVSVDEGLTWRPMVHGLMVTIQKDMVVDPANPLRIAVGNTDWTCIASDDGMQTVNQNRPTWTVQAGGSAMGLWVDYDTGTSPSTLVEGVGDRDNATGTGAGEMFSCQDPANDGAWTNEGLQDYVITLEGGSKRTLGGAVGRNGGTRVIVASVYGTGLVRKSGSTWSRPMSLATNGVCPTSESTKYHPIEWPDKNAGRIYWYDRSTGIYRSTDFGATWTRIWRANQAGLPASGNDAYSFMAADPSTTGRIYVTTSTAVYRVDNAHTVGADGAEATRVQVGSGVIERPGPIRVRDDGAVLASQRTGTGSQAALWRSTDTGSTWTDVSDAYYRACNLYAFQLVVGSDGVMWMANNGNGVTKGTTSTLSSPTKTHTTDTVIRAAGTITHSTNAVLQAIGAVGQKTITTDARLRGTGLATHLTNAYLQGAIVPIAPKVYPGVNQDAQGGNVPGQAFVCVPWGNLDTTTDIGRAPNPTLTRTQNDIVGDVALHELTGWDRRGSLTSRSYGARKVVGGTDLAYSFLATTAAGATFTALSNLTPLDEEEHGHSSDYWVPEGDLGARYGFSVDMRKVTGGTAAGSMRATLEAYDYEGNLLSSASSAFSTSTSFTRHSVELVVPSGCALLRAGWRHRSTQVGTDEVLVRNQQLQRGVVTTYVAPKTSLGSTLVLAVSVSGTSPTITPPAGWTLTKRQDNGTDGITTAIYTIVNSAVRSGVEQVTFGANTMAVAGLLELGNVTAVDTTGGARGNTRNPTTGDSGVTSQPKTVLVGVIGTNSGLDQKRIASKPSGKVSNVGERTSSHTNANQRVTQGLYYKQNQKQAAFRLTAGLNDARGFAGALVTFTVPSDASPPTVPPPLPMGVATLHGEMPPLYIAVAEGGGLGQRRVLGLEAAFDELEYGSIEPGGYDTISFRIGPHEYEAYEVYRYYATVRVTIAAGPYEGRIVFDGFLKEPQPNVDGTWQVTGVGWKQNLEDIEDQLMWQARYYGDWSTDDAEQFEDVGFKSADSIDARVGEAKLQFRVTKGTEVKNGQKSRLLWYTDGVAIRRVAGRIGSNIDVPGGDSPNWRMFLERSQEDRLTGQGGMMTVRDFDQALRDRAPEEFSEEIVAKPVVAFRFERSGQNVEELPQTYRVDISKLRVSGDAYRKTPPSWDHYSAAQIVYDICSKVDMDPAWVSTKSIMGEALPNMLPMWWTSGNWMDLMTMLATAMGFRWGVWEREGFRPKVEFRPWNRGNTVWQTHAYGPQATAISDIHPSEEQYSEVRVTYRLNRNPRTRQVRELIKDPDTNQPIFEGLSPKRRRVYRFDIPDPQPNEELAQHIARFLAIDLSTNQYTGTVTLATARDLDSGEDMPACLIRAGHFLRIHDFPHGSKTLRVYEVNATEQSVTARVGREPHKVERVLWWDALRRARRGKEASPNTV